MYSSEDRVEGINALLENPNPKNNTHSDKDTILI
jgi:hypothetical protein